VVTADELEELGATVVVVVDDVCSFVEACFPADGAACLLTELADRDETEASVAAFAPECPLVAAPGISVATSAPTVAVPTVAASVTAAVVRRTCALALARAARFASVCVVMGPR
jgi:hypothetical protein